MAQKSIGLALGSGGTRGYAIIPIIKRLEKEGIRITAVSGSSVGALMAAYYALHGEIDSLIKIIEKTSKRDWLRLVDPNNPKKSLVKGVKIRKFMVDNFFGDKTFDDTKIPLVVCATDLMKQKPTYITKGKIVDAVMASTSIPGVFPPYRLDNTLYIDGGVLDAVPTKPLLDMGLGKVVAVNLTCYAYSKLNEDFGIISTLLETMYMVVEKAAKKKPSKRLFLLELAFKPEGMAMLYFYNWKPNFNIGLRVIETRIGSLKKWLGK